MKRIVITITAAGAVLLGVAACGGSSSPAPATNAAAGTPSPAVTATPSASGSAASPAASGRRGGFRGFGGGSAAFAGLSSQLPQIRQCLSAAGLSTTALPTALPTARAFGSARPDYNPSDRPSDRPTARPSDGFGGARGRAGGLFSVLGNAQDQAALKACGITVPTLPTARPGGGSAPA